MSIINGIEEIDIIIMTLININILKMELKKCRKIYQNRKEIYDKIDINYKQMISISSGKSLINVI